MSRPHKDYSDLGLIQRLTLPQIRAHIILSLIHMPGCRQIVPEDPIAAVFVTRAGVRYNMLVNIRLRAATVELDIDIEHAGDLPHGEPERLRRRFVSEFVRRTRVDNAQSAE